MGELIAKTDIVREKGYGYYCMADEDNKISICRRIMMPKGRPKGTIKYRDAQGNPISVYEWRHQNVELWNKIKLEHRKINKMFMKGGHIDYGNTNQHTTAEQTSAATDTTTSSTS